MRLFVAVLIPPALIQRLAQEQAQLKRHLPERALRWVTPENFHITLLFLGEQPEERLPAIHSAIQQVSEQTPSFSVQVQGLGIFPNWNRPQVLWAGISEGSAMLAQMAHPLTQSLIKTPQEKPFHAHITLARLKAQRNMEFVKSLMDSVERQRNQVFGVFTVSHISLMQSELTPQGSHYIELAQFPLKRD